MLYPRPVQRLSQGAEEKEPVFRRGLLLVSLVGAITLVIVPGATALDIADANPTVGVVGQPYSYTFQLSPGSGSAGSSWSVISGSLPPGLSLSSNDRTALVYGTPTRAGSFSFYLEVRDAPGPWVCCTQEEFAIVVVEGLSIANGSLPSGSVGTQYGYQLSTSGGTATSWAVTAGSLPAGLNLGGSGAITGTPTQTVSASFTVSASDGSRSASKQLMLHVVEPLVLTPPPAKAIKLGRSFLLTPTARGGLAPYTWSSASLPSGINVNPTTGQVGGRPAALGTLTLPLTATDTLGVSQSVTATVEVVGRLSIVTTSLQSARNGKRFSAVLKTSGGGTPVSLKVVGPLPPGLTFDPGAGALSGVPTLPARKPLVTTKRVKAKTGTRLVKKVVPRAPLARTYTLYLVATDSLGQRDSQKLRLTVRP
jgi:hypothetical protein